MSYKHCHPRSASGFTLVELVTVISIVALIAAFLTIRLGNTTDDAKIAMSRTILTQKLPAALAAFRASHYGSCISLDPDRVTQAKDRYGDNADLGIVDGDATVERSVAWFLKEAGMPLYTPWEETWTAAYDHSRRLLTVYWNLTGTMDVDKTVKELTAALNKHLTVASTQYDQTNNSANVLEVNYHCR